MVLGQADRPLLERQIDRPPAHPSLFVEELLLAGAAEHERARIRRVGQERVHRPIGRGRPPHPPRADGASRQPLPLITENGDDLTRRAVPPPQLEDAADRVADLLVGCQHDPAVLVTVQPDRKAQLELAALRLVAKPAIQPGADQMQLRFGHRALQPQQQPVVEVPRRVNPVLVGDQRPRQRAQIQQLMPVRRTARQPRGLKRQDQPDMSQPDLRDQLLEPQPPVGRRARAAEVLIEDRHRRRRPAQLDRTLSEPVLARAGLVVALKLRGRRLAHIHHRAPATMRLGDLAQVTHRAPPPRSEPAAPRA